MLFGEATSLVDFGHARENSDEESPVQIILDVLAPEEVAQMSVSEKDSYFSADVDLVSDSVWSALGSKQEAREETTAKERIRNRRKRRQKRERRLDIALEIALELLPKDLSDYSTLRVATLLSGRPSLGVEGLDDEEEFEMALTSTMRKIGKQAASMRTVLDFFCFAAIHGFAASALLAAAVASGGGIVLSAMHGLSSHEHVSSVFRFISVRAFATGGRIEARSSNELELQHVIGPAVEGMFPREQFGTIGRQAYRVQTFALVQGVRTVLRFQALSGKSGLPYFMRSCDVLRVALFSWCPSVGTLDPSSSQ
mmetsp:Transcript_39819/g.158349  ORF Transcript_39819/g.158349 Transcript_39819/m.158349 type:complete len:311 (+) Transcript_39819:2319-3251(+)